MSKQYINRGVMMFEDLEKVMEMIKDESGCDHSEAVRQVSAYGWTCECGRESFLKATPELIESFKQWVGEPKLSTDPPEELYGIKLVSTKDVNKV